MSKSIETTQSTKKSLSVDSIFILVFISLYLITDLLPKIGITLDHSPLHWLYLVLINIITGIFVLNYSKNNQVPQWKYINLPIPILLYSCFFILSAISAIYAGNTPEALLRLNKMFIIFVALIYLQLFSQKKENILPQIAYIVSITLFIQTVHTMYSFTSNIGKMTPENLLVLIKSCYGNINIHAAVILFKLPFLIYSIYTSNGYKKIFFLITLCLSAALVFLTNSRANMLSMLILIFLVLLFSLYYKEKIKNVAYLLLCVVFGYFIQTQYIKYLPVRSVADEISGLTSGKDDVSSGRFQIWTNTLQLIKNKPLQGYGLNSYQVEVVPYESSYRRAWSTSKFSHNDFLQTCAESGIITGIIYLALFVYIAYLVSFRLIKRKEENKWLNFVIFLLMVSYTIDTLFNFPIHRPITQLYFILCLYLVSTSYTKKETSDDIATTKYKLKSIYLLPALVIISVLSIGANYSNFKSFEGQNTVLADANTMKLDYATVDKILPSFPNLSEIGYPIKTMKAQYLSKENRFDEALNLIRTSVKQNENNKHAYNNYIMATIFDKQQMLDSSAVYWKKCYDQYPLYEAFYANYLRVLAQKRDTTTLVSTIKHIKTLEYEPKYLYLATKYLKDSQYPDYKTKELIIEGIKKFPNDSLMKVAVKSLEYSKKNELFLKLNAISGENWRSRLEIYKQLASLEPNDFSNYENIGVCNYRLGNMNEAKKYFERAIGFKEAVSGKSELMLGIICINLKQKEKGCHYIQIAKNKKYPIEASVLKQLDPICK